MFCTNSRKEIVKIVQARCGKQHAKKCKQLLRTFGLPNYRKIVFDKHVREYSYMLVWDDMSVEFPLTE